MHRCAEIGYLDLPKNVEWFLQVIKILANFMSTIPIGIDKNVIWFDVTMNNMIFMQVLDAFQNLFSIDSNP